MKNHNNSSALNGSPGGARKPNIEIATADGNRESSRKRNFSKKTNRHNYSPLFVNYLLVLLIKLILCVMNVGSGWSSRFQHEESGSWILVYNYYCKKELSLARISSNLLFYCFCLFLLMACLKIINLHFRNNTFFI